MTEFSKILKKYGFSHKDVKGIIINPCDAEILINSKTQSELLKELYGDDLITAFEKLKENGTEIICKLSIDNITKGKT